MSSPPAGSGRPDARHAKCALPQLALSDEGREVLHAAASTGEIGRSILTTPGVPPERYEIVDIECSGDGALAFASSKSL
jgi:hypothetical protein